jgi:hypothetical protein
MCGSFGFSAYGEGNLFTERWRHSEGCIWQGPSVGFDLGGNLSKVFTLIYNLDQHRCDLSALSARGGHGLLRRGNRGEIISRTAGSSLPRCVLASGSVAAANIGYLPIREQRKLGFRSERPLA